MNLTGRGPGRDKGGVQSGRISQNFSRLFRSVKLARRNQYAKSQRHMKFIEENEDNWKKVRVFDSYLEP